MTIKLTTPAAVATALASLLATAPVLAANYGQGARFDLAFASRYDGELFTGRFSSFDTRLSFDPAKPEAGKLDVTIALTSAATGNEDRDSTLQTSDFFDVAKHAQARYSASGFRKLADGRYATDGTLELRGVRKPVTLTFAWSGGAQPVLEGKAVVKRLDFGVGTGDWADTATIPNEVNISTRVLLKPL
ncbi:YceI family protein [Pseudoxanthomonas sp. NC8]|nr:YceI family protein [Pseudoxanthomonas sp. NC8]